MFDSLSKWRLSALFILIIALNSGCSSSQTAAKTAVDLSKEELAEAIEVPVVVEESAEALAKRELSEAIGLSSELLEADWHEIDVEAMDFLLRVFDAAIAEDDAELASMLYDDMASSHFDEVLLADMKRRLLLLQKAYKELRSDAMARFLGGELTAIDDFWYAFDIDPLYGRGFTQDIEPDGRNALSALGGGSTVSLKYSVDGETVAAIKPDQDLRQTMYRSEIAFFRLCEYLSCSFIVPENVPVRFTRKDFNTLYEQSKTSRDSAYQSKFVHLIWETIEGERYLYATFKAWISSFTFFPIEVTSVWRPLMAVNASQLPETRTFLQRLLNGARPETSKSIRRFMAYAGDMTTQALLKQISDLIVVDFLSNNWDRFSGDINNYGANCHFTNGGIIAIDNGAAFPAWHAPRVVRRLKLVKTFSKDLVQALRLIDADALYPRLFPNPTREELKSLQRFTERRAQALEYIDNLIAKHGEAAVLIY